MHVAVTTADLQAVLDWYESILVDLFDRIDWYLPMTEVQVAAFRLRCECAVQASWLTGDPKCPVCHAMRLHELDPLCWLDRCRLCPLAAHCWPTAESVYWQMCSYVEDGDAATAFVAIGDAMLAVDALRQEIEAEGGTRWIEVPD